MLAFRQVDVFTDRLGSGNPLAVVHGADGLSGEQMQRFAAWTDLSETTFLLEPQDPAADYRVRIFTPTEELPFAGHPTIGTCHAWLEQGGRPHAEGTVVQECGVGRVELRQIDGRLAFATPPLMRSGSVDDADVARTLAALGLDPSEVVATAWIDNGPGWVGVLVASVDRLRSLTPRLDSGQMIGVAALTGQPDLELEVRAFFDAGGTREDPVTGSLNGSLAQWLVERGELDPPWIASQGSALGRDGRVHVSAADGDLWIGGDAVTGIVGQLDPSTL